MKLILVLKYIGSKNILSNLQRAQPTGNVEKLFTLSFSLKLSAPMDDIRMILQVKMCFLVPGVSVVL